METITAAQPIAICLESSLAAVAALVPGNPSQSVSPHAEKGKVCGNKIALVLRLATVENEKRISGAGSATVSGEQHFSNI